MTLGQQIALAATDRLAPKTKTAVDGTDGQQLQEHAVGIAMHEPRQRRMDVVADRIGAFLRRDRRFAKIGDKLSRNRILRIVAVDQRHDLRRNGDAVALRHLIETVDLAHEARVNQIGDRGQRARRRAIPAAS